MDTPAHRCYVPDIDGANSTNTPLLNETVPYETIDGVYTPSQCEQYTNYSHLTGTREPCTNGYHYDPNSGYISTIVTEVRVKNI